MQVSRLLSIQWTSLLFATLGANLAFAQLSPPAPISRATLEQLQSEPDRLKKLTEPQQIVIEPPPPIPPAGSPWTPLASQPLFNAGAMLLLTDGTVMVNDQGVQNNGGVGWWRLAPDRSGSYVHGTWTSLAAPPSGYAPLYFASAVLPDGRVIIEGGEYNNGTADWTSLGAIYNPVSDHWTMVSPPSGWASIGDAPSAVLADGSFMLGACCSTAQALLNPRTLTWTAIGTHQADSNNEQGWTLLPKGDLLTIDANNPIHPTNAEIFNPTTGAWSSAGSTLVKLDDTDPDGSGSHELGPAVLLPNGTVFAVGATGHNAIYRAATNSWSPGPAFPVINGKQYDVADGPAALLPSGKVLMAASPGIYQKPTHFFEFDGTKLTQLADTATSASIPSYNGFMLVLPTGQIMFNSRVGDIEVYTDPTPPDAAASPTIASVPTTLTHGHSYLLSGTQLNGLSQGAAYGDDYQSATNYPLVRIVNAASGHVFYARTFSHSSMSVAPKNVSSTHFFVPAGIETGASRLYVVANGIASKPVGVTVH